MASTILNLTTKTTNPNGFPSIEGQLFVNDKVTPFITSQNKMEYWNLLLSFYISLLDPQLETSSSSSSSDTRVLNAEKVVTKYRLYLDCNGIQHEDEDGVDCSRCRLDQRVWNGILVAKRILQS